MTKNHEKFPSMRRIKHCMFCYSPDASCVFLICCSLSIRSDLTRVTLYDRISHYTQESQIVFIFMNVEYQGQSLPVNKYAFYLVRFVFCYIPPKKETHTVKLIKFSESSKCNINFSCNIL